MTVTPRADESDVASNAPRSFATIPDALESYNVSVTSTLMEADVMVSAICSFSTPARLAARLALNSSCLVLSNESIVSSRDSVKETV